MAEQQLSSDSLAELTRLAQCYVETEAAVEKAELQLKAEKARLTALREEDIPNFMTELGVQEMKLEDGTKVEVKGEVYCSITEANKGLAFEWLEENGFGGLIKTELGLSFGRDELDKALDAMEQIKALGLEPTISRDVHAATLKAFLKERLENAESVPLDLFGARALKVAKFSKPKAKKK